MCQLTFIFAPRRFNRYLLYNQLVINSRISHKDGCGFYQQSSGIFKTKEAASEFKELPDNICRMIKTSEPIIGHVRLTTSKVSVSDEKSHPFETDKLVLAHNGTLILKDLKTKDSYGDRIDTEMFLYELDLLYDGTNFVEAFNNAMDKFYGAFAFLIYSKLEQKYFAVRGSSRKLHITKILIGNTPGLMINTEKDELEKCLVGVKHFMKLENHNLSWGDITLVDENTINEIDLLNDVLIKIGDTKENSIPVAPVAKTSYASDINDIYLKGYYKFNDFMHETGLRFYEMDNIVNIMFGYGIAYMSEDDFEEFVTLILPKLLAYYSSKKRAMWTNILNNSELTDRVQIINKYDLEFPYFLNKTETLKEVFNIMTANKNKRSVV